MALDPGETSIEVPKDNVLGNVQTLPDPASDGNGPSVALLTFVWRQYFERINFVLVNLQEELATFEKFSTPANDAEEKINDLIDALRRALK